MSELTEVIGSESPLVRAVLRGVPINTTVSLRDEMLLHAEREQGWDAALCSYFQRGIDASRLHRHVLDRCFDGRRDIDVLEFAAGFGRVSRFLTLEHTPERVTVSDIQSDALAFQRRQFRVATLLSSAKPAHFTAPKQFDLLLAVSFFSHTPPETFRAWLEVMRGAVKTGGVLVLTVHDETLLGPNERAESGITFRPTSESDRLDPSDYGTTWVSDEYMRARLREAFPDRSVTRIPRGMSNLQDVYVVHQDGRRGVADFDQGPFGYVGMTLLHHDELHVIGWSSHHDPRFRVQGLTVQINAATAATTCEFFDRPEVAQSLGDPRHLRSGFHVSVPLARTVSRTCDVLTVTARSEQAETVIFVGTIASALLESSRAELVAAGRDEAIFPRSSDFAARVESLKQQIANRR